MQLSFPLQYFSQHCVNICFWYFSQYFFLFIFRLSISDVKTFYCSGFCCFLRKKAIDLVVECWEPILEYVQPSVSTTSAVHNVKIHQAHFSSFIWSQVLDWWNDNWFGIMLCIFKFLFPFTLGFHFLQQPWQICVGTSKLCSTLPTLGFFLHLFVFWLSRQICVCVFIWFLFYFTQQQEKAQWENMCRKLEFMQQFAQHTWKAPLF